MFESMGISFLVFISFSIDGLHRYKLIVISLR